MKKVIFVAIAIMVLCVSVALTVKSFSGRDYVLDANVEVIASSESNAECYKTLITDPSDTVKYCGTCSDQPGRGRRKSVCY